jgi:hypothetical protein
MKSAYELAMERLEKASGPSKKLSDDQKAQIAEIEKVYQAKIAETKLAYESRLRGAESVEDLNKIQTELAEAIAAAEVRRDKEKEAVWNAQ